MGRDGRLGAGCSRLHFRTHEEPRAEAEDFCVLGVPGEGWGGVLCASLSQRGQRADAPLLLLSQPLDCCASSRGCLGRSVPLACVTHGHGFPLAQDLCARPTSPGVYRSFLGFSPFSSAARDRYSSPTCCQVSHEGFLCLWFTSGWRTRGATEEAEATAWGLTLRLHDVSDPLRACCPQTSFALSAVEWPTMAKLGYRATVAEVPGFDDLHSQGQAQP